MNIIDIYEAAFNRYISKLETLQQMEDWYVDRELIEECELSTQSADITAELIGKACGPRAISNDIPF